MTVTPEWDQGPPRLGSLDFKGNLLAKPPPGLRMEGEARREILGEEGAASGRDAQAAGPRGGGIHGKVPLRAAVWSEQGQADAEPTFCVVPYVRFKKRQHRPVG